MRRENRIAELRCFGAQDALIVRFLGQSFIKGFALGSFHDHDRDVVGLRPAHREILNRFEQLVFKVFRTDGSFGANDLLQPVFGPDVEHGPDVFEVR